jgi:hypothetical protein
MHSEAHTPELSIKKLILHYLGVRQQLLRFIAVIIFPGKINKSFLSFSPNMTLAICELALSPGDQIFSISQVHAWQIFVVLFSLVPLIGGHLVVIYGFFVKGVHAQLEMKIWASVGGCLLFIHPGFLLHLKHCSGRGGEYIRLLPANICPSPYSNKTTRIEKMEEKNIRRQKDNNDKRRTKEDNEETEK